MIVAFDTHYRENIAKTVMVCFENWTDETPSDIVVETIEGVADYVPGQFYKRELPCIMSILSKSDLSTIDTIIVDGYVVLNDEGKIGLGGYLYQELGAKIPIIGVAKTGFHDNKKHVRELLRGESKKPLYITAMGVEVDTALACIQAMHGQYRMPTLLQILDTNTKAR